MSRHRYTGARLIKREGKRERMSIATQCRETRRALVEDARARRLALREALAAERVALRGTCLTRLANARRDTDKAIEEAKRTALDLARLREVTRSPAQRHAAERARLRAAENIRESDDEVRRNLPDDLAFVWSRVKHRPGMRKSARRTRTEAFLEWVEENGATVSRILRERGEQLPAEESEAAYRERKRSELRKAGIAPETVDGYPLMTRPTYHGPRRDVMVARSSMRGRPWLTFLRDDAGAWKFHKAHKTRRDAVGNHGPARAPLKLSTRAAARVASEDVPF